MKAQLMKFECAATEKSNLKSENEELDKIIQTLQNKN